MFVDFTSLRSPCYTRTAERPGPHNLLLDTSCAVTSSTTAGPARPLWTIDSSWIPPGIPLTDTTFTLTMDGVGVGWTWDRAAGMYLRSQDGQPHLTVAGTQISARNVVSDLHRLRAVAGRCTITHSDHGRHRSSSGASKRQSDPCQMVQGNTVRPYTFSDASDRSTSPTQHRHDLHRARTSTLTALHALLASRAGRLLRERARGRRGRLAPTSG